MIAIPTSSDGFETYIRQLEPEALRDLLPTDGSARSATVGALSDAIGRHLASLSEDTLLRLAYAGLQSLSDDNRFVLRCAEELIDRGSIQGQVAFANIVTQARDRYDPGHRAFAHTVLDQLIDDVLPRFALAPLTALLQGLDFDVLSGADGFAELFAAAFAKVEAEIPKDLLDAVRQYADGCRRSSGNLGEAMGFLEAAAARCTNNELLASAIAELKADMELEAQLETGELDVARALLERVGRDLPFKRAVQFHNFLQPLLTFAGQLPYEFVESVFVRAWEDERQVRSPETVLGRTLWPLFVNDPEAAQSFCLRFVETCGDRKLFLQVVEWTVRDAGRERPEGQQLAKDTLALLQGLDPKEERAREALKEQRSSLSSEISWAFMHDEIDQARRLMEDESSRLLMDADLVEEILRYAQVTGRIKAGDLKGARAIAEVCLDLLIYKRAHPDLVPQPKDGERLSTAERRMLRRGGMPSGFSVIEFVANALVLAASEANLGTPFAERVAALAKELVAQETGDSRYATLPFNLGCYHARRGEKNDALHCVKVAVAWGKPRTAFLEEADFSAYHQDPEFLAAIEPNTATENEDGGASSAS